MNSLLVRGKLEDIHPHKFERLRLKFNYLEDNVYTIQDDATFTKEEAFDLMTLSYPDPIGNRVRMTSDSPFNLETE